MTPALTNALLLLGVCWPIAMAAPAPASGASPTPPSAARVAAKRQQALQTLDKGDLRRGCSLLRGAIDQTGALLARSPSPALEADLRFQLQRLKPCIRKGL